jgi:hypothetical protein
MVVLSAPLRGRVKEAVTMKALMSSTRYFDSVSPHGLHNTGSGNLLPIVRKQAIEHHQKNYTTYVD